MELLYLHGRGEDPRDPPGDLVLSHPWKTVLRCPPLTSEWIAQPFPHQVSIVDEWLEDSRGAIGFSWGAWLLLCAVHERLERGIEAPNLLLLSGVLGEGNYTGTGNWKAPRQETIFRALGLEASPGPTPFSPQKLRFIYGREDTITPTGLSQRLLDAGHSTLELEAGHLLRSGSARNALSHEFRRFEHHLRPR